MSGTLCVVFRLDMLVQSEICYRRRKKSLAVIFVPLLVLSVHLIFLSLALPVSLHLLSAYDGMQMTGDE